MAKNKLSTDSELFHGTSFGDVMRDIYDNSKKRHKQIDTLVDQLKKLINNVSDATMIVPLIKEYLDVGVKNDDLLVKLAAVFQRHESAINKIKRDVSTGTLDDKDMDSLLKMSEDSLLQEVQQLLGAKDEDVNELVKRVNQTAKDLGKK